MSPSAFPHHFSSDLLLARLRRLVPQGTRPLASLGAGTNLSQENVDADLKKLDDSLRLATFLVGAAPSIADVFVYSAIFATIVRRRYRIQDGSLTHLCRSHSTTCSASPLLTPLAGSITSSTSPPSTLTATVCLS